MGKARIWASSILSNGLFPHQVLRDPKAREPGPTVTFSWTKTPLGQWAVCQCSGECSGGERVGPGPPEVQTLTAFSRCQRKGLSIRVSQAGSQGPKVSPTCPRVSKRGGEHLLRRDCPHSPDQACPPSWCWWLQSRAVSGKSPDPGWPVRPTLTRTGP